MKLKGKWGDHVWMRDPAVIKKDGVWHCFYTHLDRREIEHGTVRLSLGRIQSEDLEHWSEPEILLSGPEGFSSPGNILKTENDFLLCLQSYPVNEGETYGSDACRLWTMKSKDLLRFEPPTIISGDGCKAVWAKTKRQIDPFMVQKDNSYYVFYKTDGCIGLLKSEDLKNFEECSDTPVLQASDTPDGSTVENPCVIQLEQGYRMFFAPCREGRGIGTAWSEDLLHWKEVEYLEFPKEKWAPGGPTAPMVVDDRSNSGKWLMFYHGDSIGAHGGNLGIAFSDDLIHWNG